MHTQIWFASELKSIVDQQCEFVQEFPDGHYWTPEEGFVKWYKPEWDSDTYVHSGDAKAHNVREALAQAVRAQCMSDVPFGLLLSGGLDSAVVATLLKPIMEELGQVYVFSMLTPEFIVHAHQSIVTTFCFAFVRAERWMHTLPAAYMS
jgi:asparagine synthase (glutamine-hydrolysing)